MRPATPVGRPSGGSAIRLSVTGNDTPPEEHDAAPGIVVDDDPAVREAIGLLSRDDLPAYVVAHDRSPLAWAELADIALSEQRSLEAYGFATVAHQRGLEALAAAGWTAGDPVSWSSPANRGVLRAAHALARAASAIGLMDEAATLAEFLEQSDPDAEARIDSEHTPTQLIAVIPPSARPTVVAPVTEAYVIRGED